MSAEKNEATLKDLFNNLGPGLDRWMDAYRRCLTPECAWYMQGWPTVNGIDELGYQLQMLNALMGANANPILEWRKIHNYGDKIIFERKGSFADVNGKTITDWDICGIFSFNAAGKICEIRDYFDNTGPYAKLKGVIPDEQIAMINKLAVNPLATGYKADTTFYKRMCEQMAAVMA